MKLEQQVVSLELAQKMKELGFEQESLFSWWVNPYAHSEKSRWMLLASDTKRGGIERRVSAYTVAELGEMFPVKIRVEKDPTDFENYEFTGYKTPEHFSCTYMCEERLNGQLFIAKTEADARAKMLIYLKENNLLDS